MFCAKPTFLNLIVDSNGKRLKSERRWISAPIIIPRRRDLDCICESLGRFGLIEQLNKLMDNAQAADLLLEFLNTIDFDDLSHSLVDIRHKLAARTQVIEDEEDPILKPRWHIDYNDVFEDIVKRGVHRFEKTSILPIDKSLWGICFEEMFNRFMAVNKLIFWICKQHPVERIEELRYIKKNTTLLTNFITEMRKAFPVGATELEKDHLIKEHVQTCSYLVNWLQETSGYSRKTANKYVIEEFHRAFAESLGVLSNDKKEISDVGAVLTEYAPLRIRLTAEEILTYCARIQSEQMFRNTYKY
jgi:ribosomal protein S18